MNDDKYKDYRSNKKLHTHSLPEADPAWCSCCRKGIQGGYDNVVKINKAPEKITKLDGSTWGTKGESRVGAYYHAKCFQENHTYYPGPVECKYCGIFSRAKTTKDGRNMKDVCACSCHNNQTYCSLLVS